MPMPLFGRRQSGAKALEDGEKAKSADVGAGFTVLSQEEVAARRAKAAAEKERAGRRSIGSLFPNKSKNRSSTYEEDALGPGGNRGSNASSAANSALSHPYSTGSSARMSSSSTLPSSESADDIHFGRNGYGFQPPPRPLAARDRASTLGMTGVGVADHPGRYYSRVHDTSAPPVPPPPPPHLPQPSYSYDSGFNRHRAMTASSYASTAQPPKLDLGLSNFNDFSTEMFGSREDKSPSPTERQERAGASKPPPPPPHTFSPPPPSPYSPHDADAPLLASSAASPRDSSSADISSTPQKMTTSSRSQYQPISNSSTPRNSANSTVNNAKSRARGNSIAIPLPFSEDELDNEPLFPAVSKSSFKAPAPVEPEQEPEDESPKRMMTATEYERLKKLAAQDPQDSETDEYASDPDEELSDSEQKRRDRWAREKQQGDLAVNRQIYKKTVGGASDPQVNRFSAQSSAFMAEVNETEVDRQQFERDGDWDVPLAALAAHGFPKGGSTARPSLSGNRLPTSSQTELHTSGQFVTLPSIPRPASATGSLAGAPPRINPQLPAFARNLPADPYALAGGVVPAHPREQLKFNGRSSSVPYAQPPMPQMPQMAPPTNSTLVGIIQGEEVARAARRGSPNAAVLASQQQQNMFQQNMQPAYQQQARPMSQQQMSMMQMGGLQNGAMPEFQTLQQQIALQQQMMVQMQQQMMQMQIQSSAASMINGQAPTPMVMPQFPQSNPVQSHLLQLPGQVRPMSMASNMGGMGGLGNMGFQQRRPDSAYQGSIYAPSVMGMPPLAPRHGGYAPSIAPSERNTTGLSARYRSVGYPNGDQHSSTGSRAGTPGPVRATLKQAGSQGKLQNRSTEESDEERYFAEAAAKARARRAKSSEPTTRV